MFIIDVWGQGVNSYALYTAFTLTSMLKGSVKEILNTRCTLSATCTLRPRRSRPAPRLLVWSCSSLVLVLMELRSGWGRLVASDDSRARGSDQAMSRERTRDRSSLSCSTQRSRGTSVKDRRISLTPSSGQLQCDLFMFHRTQESTLTGTLRA